MKALLIGLGGVGSYLAEYLNKAYETGQLDHTIEIVGADPDIVEPKNLGVQNFLKKDVGKYKAAALRERFEFLNFLTKAIKEDKDLKGYDFIIVAADNFPVRKLVFEYCHKYSLDYLDLRAEGRDVFIMTTQKDGSVALSTLGKSKESASCQPEATREVGIIEYGYLVAAAMGLQTFLNYWRSNPNFHNKKTYLRL